MKGTKKKWGYKIPDNMYNSLVSSDGTAVKNNWEDENGVLADWNYDEPKDPEDLVEDETTFDDLAKDIKFDPEAAEKAKQEDTDNEKEVN